MTTPSIGIANHRFAFGYYRQTFWNWLIGAAFFLGGLGAGLFVLSMLTDHTAGMLIGYLIVIVGKNTAHMLFLGRPERFWRAAMRPDRSWIARGIWAMGFFAVSGAVLLLPRVFGPAWQLSDILQLAARWIAILSALIIMFYDGFVMNASPGVAFWRTRLLPLLLLMYATLGGATLSLTIRELRGETAPAFLPSLEHGLVAVNFVLLAAYLARMNRSVPAARETLRQWLGGPVHPRVFWIGSACRLGGDAGPLGRPKSGAGHLARGSHRGLRIDRRFRSGHGSAQVGPVSGPDCARLYKSGIAAVSISSNELSASVRPCPLGLTEPRLWRRVLLNFGIVKESDCG